MIEVVTSTGVSTYYNDNDYAQAFNTAAAGSTIILHSDIETAASITINRNLTFDLNGHTFSKVTFVNNHYYPAKDADGNYVLAEDGSYTLGDRVTYTSGNKTIKLTTGTDAAFSIGHSGDVAKSFTIMSSKPGAKIFKATKTRNVISLEYDDLPGQRYRRPGDLRQQPGGYPQAA